MVLKLKQKEWTLRLFGLWTVFVPCLLAISASATDIGPARLASRAGQSSISGGGNSSMPVFSKDGHHLMFLSDANNLVTNDNQQPYMDLFVRDMFSGDIHLVSVDKSGL